MFKNIAIIGDGAMGSVCGMLLAANGMSSTLWGHDAQQLGRISAARENVLFMPGYPLPSSMAFESDDRKALAGRDLIVSAVPCQFTRRIWQRLKPHVEPGCPIVSVTKGIENETLMRTTEILADVLGDDHDYATLSGPTIADELARGLPATACVAAANTALAQEIQETFNSPAFRVYTNDDLIGVELCGAVKNVIAIAAGIIDGIGAGDNAKAALLSRGLAEIQRLGLALGAKTHTFVGLSGLGDLVTTCVSPKGRNRSFGERIGKGMTAKDALSATSSVVEGAATCQSVLDLARRLDVEMPITEAVHDVIAGHKTVQVALHELMTRSPKAEY